MSTNGINVCGDTEMAECDGEKVVTMMDVLKEQEDFEEDVNAVLGASDDKNCTYSKGYIKRQAIYACKTCCPDAIEDPTKRAGVCLACSLTCHEKHELIELYTKRNFRCDCGNPKLNQHPCQFTPNKTEVNEENTYNQNFGGVYCICHRPYPDPDSSLEQEMIQCIVCEDWFHSSHLDAVVPPNENYAEMICKSCMNKNEFLYDYTELTINKEDVDVDILNESSESVMTSPKEISTANTEKSVDNITLNDKVIEVDNIGHENVDKDTEEAKQSEQYNNKPNLFGVDVQESLDNELNLSKEEQNIGTSKEVEDTSHPTLINSVDNVSDDNKEKINSEIVPDLTDHTEEIKPSTTNSTHERDIEMDQKICEQNEQAKLTHNSKELQLQNSIVESKSVDHKLQEQAEDSQLKDPVENIQHISQDDEIATENESKNETIDMPSADDISEHKTETFGHQKNQNVHDCSSTDFTMNESNDYNNPNTMNNDKHNDDNINDKGKPEHNIKENKDTQNNNTDNEDKQDNDITENKNGQEFNLGNKNDKLYDGTLKQESIQKRKLSSDCANNDLELKKTKLDNIQCVRPRGLKKIHKGATFWPSNFRHKLCTCSECISMYKDLSVLFLIDPDDTVTAYEELGKERTDGKPASQYEKGMAALSSLGRVQQINALTEYSKLRDKLLEFLKSFKERKVIVKEEDIKAFFAGMKPVREPDGVYFCR